MKIAHISDIHCGEVHFVPGLMERAINEINDQEPDIVVCSGDLTTFGFKEEYHEAKRYLDRIETLYEVLDGAQADSPLELKIVRGAEERTVSVGV